MVANLDSPSGEGLPAAPEGGRGPLLPLCVPYVSEMAPLPASSVGKPKCKSVFWLVPVAVSVFSSCQQQLTGQVHPCTAIVTAHWQTSDPAGPDNGKLLISVGSADLKWMPDIMSSAVLDSDKETKYQRCAACPDDLLAKKYRTQTNNKAAFLSFSPNKQRAVNAWVNAKKPQPRCDRESNCPFNRGGPWQPLQVLSTCHRGIDVRVGPSPLNSTPIHQPPESE